MSRVIPSHARERAFPTHHPVRSSPTASEPRSGHSGTSPTPPETRTGPGPVPQQGRPRGPYEPIPQESRPRGAPSSPVTGAPGEAPCCNVCAQTGGSCCGSPPARSVPGDESFPVGFGHGGAVHPVSVHHGFSPVAPHMMPIPHPHPHHGPTASRRGGAIPSYGHIGLGRGLGQSTTTIADYGTAWAIPLTVGLISVAAGFGLAYVLAGRK
jgi:hypothetical protein